MNYFKINIWLVFFLILLFPVKILAASVGFVPSTGIWLSETQVKAGSSVIVYSVIINNSYPWFSGKVGFYDNSQLFYTVEIKNLAKDSVAQIKATWMPTVGEHALSAQFIKAYSINEDGKSQLLEINAINNASGLPLVVGGAVLPATEQPQNTAVQIEVKNENGKLIITAPIIKSSDTAIGVKTITNVASSASNYVEQNRDVLVNAQQLTGTVTSTVGKIEAVYEGTKDVINKTQDYYNRGQETLQKARPYLDATKSFLNKLSPWWNLITNNSDPKRIAIIIIAVIVLWIIYKLSRGRVGKYYDR